MNSTILGREAANIVHISEVMVNTNCLQAYLKRTCKVMSGVKDAIKTQKDTAKAVLNLEIVQAL